MAKVNDILFEEDPFGEVEPLVPTEPVSISLELTNEEKKKALDSWNSGTKSLQDIVQTALGSGEDCRSRRGILVKKYLASLDVNFDKAKGGKRKTDAIVLTEAQKEYIRNHASTTTWLSMAKEIFKNKDLSSLSAQGRAVSAYFNSLDPHSKIKDAEDAELVNYKAPKSVEQAMARANKYIHERYDFKKLIERDRVCLTALIKYMHIHQYLFVIRRYEEMDERELFESSFVRFCYDKPDLGEEELTLYINLCVDVVNLGRMQKDLNSLMATRDEILEETGKIPMAVVDAIGKAYSEMDANQKRQKALYEVLQGKRAERINKRKQENASILQLVDQWKDESKRLQFIRLAELRKKRLSEEVEKLETMDDLRFQLWGVGREEILHS